MIPIQGRPLPTSSERMGRPSKISTSMSISIMMSTLKGPMIQRCPSKKRLVTAPLLRRRLLVTILCFVLFCPYVCMSLCCCLHAVFLIFLDFLQTWLLKLLREDREYWPQRLTFRSLGRRPLGRRERLIHLHMRPNVPAAAMTPLRGKLRPLLNLRPS
ncbi:hypothetical protein Dimus_039400 [Dionaea muscipula]